MQFGPDCEVDVLWPGNCEADVHRQVFHRAGLFAASFPFSSIFFFCVHFIYPAGSLGCLTWVRLQQPQEQRYPLLTVCVVFWGPNKANAWDL